MGGGWVMPAGRAPRTRWTLPAPPGTHRHARRWGRPGRRVEAGERVELVPCPLGQRGKGHHGAASPARGQEGGGGAGPRRARARGGFLPKPSTGAGLRKPQEAGRVVSCPCPVSLLFPTAPAGSVEVPLTARDRARWMGGIGYGDGSPPRGGTGGRQSRKGPEAHVGSPGRERACTSLLAEPPGGDWLPNPRIEVPTAVGPPFVRNSIRWQSRY